VLVRVSRLIRRDVRGVDLAPLAVQSGAGTVRLVGEQAHDLAVGCLDALREFHGFSLVVPALGVDRILVRAGQARLRLSDHPAHTLGKDLSHVRHVADDLERGPFVELDRAKLIAGGRTRDPRDRRGVVGQGERRVVVVAEPFYNDTVTGTVDA
jgi:hypothetical protein